MGCLRAVIFVLRTGKMVASQAMTTQSDETNANWIKVKVAGLLKAFRMDLEEVLVSAEDAYQARQRIWVKCVSPSVLP
jgi:hypothetical protein